MIFGNINFLQNCAHNSKFAKLAGRFGKLDGNA